MNHASIEFCKLPEAKEAFKLDGPCPDCNGTGGESIHGDPHICCHCHGSGKNEHRPTFEELVEYLLTHPIYAVRLEGDNKYDLSLIEYIDKDEYNTYVNNWELVKSFRELTLIEAAEEACRWIWEQEK